ncbi:MAG TPA: ATP-binding protein [Ruminiclostridium sp.]
MLIEFTVGNYLSFKDKATISMLASGKRELRDSNVINNVKKGLSLLKSSAIYGANASGKSNLFSAVAFMMQFIKNSYKESQAGEAIEVIPYLLDAGSKTKASFFEMVFIIDKTVYRYGFEVTSDEVFKEWLFIQKGDNQKNVFLREKDNIIIDDKSLGNAVNNVPIKLRGNGLYLSALSMYGVEFGTNIVEWMTRKIIILQGKNVSGTVITEAGKMKGYINKNEMLAFLKAADINIIDFEVDKSGVNMFYKIYDENNIAIGSQKMSLFDLESHGTRKLFFMANFIILALREGKIIFIDELDEALHPDITKFILNIFNSTDLNEHNAQLIINTHDTTLLNNKILRRDQIWFTKKNRYGASKILSLVEYNDSNVRSDEAYSKNYLAGKYGGVPYVRPGILLSALEEGEKDGN